MTLAEYRAGRGLTQEQCAEALGLKSKARVCEVETKGHASVALALKIDTWSGGKVSASSLNPAVALVAEHMAGRRRRKVA